MNSKQYRDFLYVAKEDYDKKRKVNGEELAVYSPQKLKDLYPQKDYEILGETFEKKKRDKAKDIGHIELNEKRLNVGESGKHNRLFKKQGAFIAVEGGGFIAMLQSRILTMLLLGVVLVGLVGGGLLMLGDRSPLPDDEDTIDPGIKPAVVDILTISGSVTKAQQGIEGASISLQKGNQELSVATTDKEGNYLLTEVKNGVYNLVCTYGDSVLTKIAVVRGESLVVDFVFPTDDLHDVGEITHIEDTEILPESHSVEETPTETPTEGGDTGEETPVEPPEENPEQNPTEEIPVIPPVVTSEVKAVVKITDENTPPIAVGGLETEAMLHMIVGRQVDLTLLATKLEEVPAEEKKAIEEISGELEMTYYDFSILKEIFKNQRLESSEYLKNTKTVLEIAVPHPSAKAMGTYVFRFHDGSVLRFEELASKPTGDFTDGTYYVTADTVYVYTNCFSTYAIGSTYIDQTVRGSDTITYSGQITVNLKTKEISMLYQHDEDSTNDAKIQIYLVGENGNLLISESGIIPVGYQIESMHLIDGIKNMPSVGTYKGLMRIIYPSGKGEQTSTNIEIPLSVAITQ